MMFYRFGHTNNEEKVSRSLANYATKDNVPEITTNKAHTSFQSWIYDWTIFEKIDVNVMNDGEYIDDPDYIDCVITLYTEVSGI